MGEKEDVSGRKVSEVDKNTVKCDHCELKINSKVERVRAHLEKCKTRKSKNYEPKYNVGSSITSSSVASNPSDLSNVLVTVSPISTPTQASKLKSFVVKSSTYEKDYLNKQVACFFFSSNLSFNSVEGPEFKKLCSLLRPGYVPPNRKKLRKCWMMCTISQLKLVRNLRTKLQLLSTKMAGQVFRMIQLLPTQFMMEKRVFCPTLLILEKRKKLQIIASLSSMKQL